MGKKNLLSMNKKVKRKNQISKYYISSSERLIKIIYKRLIDEKPLNLVRYRKKKSKNPKYIWWKTS